MERDDNMVDNPHISLVHFRCIGLLWCEGSPKEKAFEFYDMLQDNNQATIAASDKDLPHNIHFMIDIATKHTFLLGSKYMDLGGAPYTSVTEEMIAENNSEDNIETFFEGVIDDIFDAESTLPRKDFEQLCIEKTPYLFSPKEIRKKMGYN